ncbi:MAG: tetratricopeptide repeat protein [Spirochaetes bacterium]|nr:tetratricopeptide repeat protein [Spirochaetota bacterium]
MISDNFESKSKFEQAYYFEKQGKTEEAIHYYAGIGKDEPRHREALLSMAALYSKLNRTIDSLFCFEKAVSIEPDYLSIFNIGNIYYKLSDYKKAVLFFDRARGMKESFMPAKLMLGLAFSRMNNLTAAESCFHEVLTVSPANEVALIALSMLKYERGDFESSEELSNRILLINPSNVTAKKLRYKVLLNLGRIEESKEEVLDLSKTDKKYTDYSTYVSALPLETFSDKYGTMESKIETLEKKAEETHDPKTMVSLSLCYLLRGDSDSAIEFLYKAREVS